MSKEMFAVVWLRMATSICYIVEYWPQGNGTGALDEDEKHT